MNKKSLIILLTTLVMLTACQRTQAEPLYSQTPEIQISPTNTLIPISPTVTDEETVPQITKTPLPDPTQSQNVTMLAVGDIMLGRTIADLMVTAGYQSPFAYTAETLKKGDLTIGNLECPISSHGQAVEKNFVFRAPPIASKALAFAGFDVVSLSNNHVLDYGPIALLETIETLQSENIYTVGAGMDSNEAYAPLYLDINGLKLAFLSFTDVPITDFDYLAWEAGSDQPGIAWAHQDKVRKGVQSAKKNADIVIVLIHNGYEFCQSVSDGQQEIAKLAIDSGASLVIGSHPHVLQRIEPYKDGLIVYSMGNFVFDNFLFPPNYSAILSVELSDRGVESYELIQVVIQLNGVPEIMPYTIEE